MSKRMRASGWLRTAAAGTALSLGLICGAASAQQAEGWWENDAMDTYDDGFFAGDQGADRYDGAFGYDRETEWWQPSDWTDEGVDDRWAWGDADEGWMSTGYGDDSWYEDEAWYDESQYGWDGGYGWQADAGWDDDEWFDDQGSRQDRNVGYGAYHDEQEGFLGLEDEGWWGEEERHSYYDDAWYEF